MSSSHNDSDLTETKPISFTVPFILASVFILIMIIVLSLCDPKKEEHKSKPASESIDNAHH